ncbi:MAG TPA: shikimate dehydrogenase [Burkholderiales bacterium]|nr:shikimate dehydrogenase [Burkholderiales bacterium]
MAQTEGQNGDVSALAPSRAAKGKFLIGLIGEGIQGSRSPALHEEEARHQGLTLHYELIDLALAGQTVADLPRLIESAQAMGFAGLNITHPCKQAVLPLLDELSEEARAIDAVNTVVFRQGARKGFNTDRAGFAIPFREKLADAARQSVALIGAGGAGSAVAYALLESGTERLFIVDRDEARAKALAKRMAARFPDRVLVSSDEAASVAKRADGIVHATPTGMASYPGLPFDPSLLRPGMWVVEVVYVPLETELLRVARSRGCRTLDGGGMAVWQAVEAFELFTGVKPDAARMEAHFRRMV